MPPPPGKKIAVLQSTEFMPIGQFHVRGIFFRKLFAKQNDEQD
jgi:hypothetical protein